MSGSEGRAAAGGAGAFDRSAPDPAARAIREFRRRFGAAPAVVASAPGRVNIVGEHVDHAGGVVLPMPIAERTAVALGSAVDGEGLVVSLELRREAAAPPPANFERLEPSSPQAWLNAAMGPLRLLADRGVQIPSLCAVVASEIPIGAGLSSSAALGTAMAAAALRWTGQGLDAVALARLVQDAEHRFTGTPCGIMDMLTAIAGRRGEALRLDCRTLERRGVPLPDALAMVLVDTGVRHALASSDYGLRRRETEEAARRLRVLSLREVTEATLEQANLPELLHRRARHVLREIARVDRAIEALRRGDLAELGSIVSASHASLREDFEVSTPEVERVVGRILSAHPGVLGARMVGGGFGGSVLVIVERTRLDTVGAALASAGLAAPPHSMRLVRSGDGYTAAAVEGSSS